MPELAGSPADRLTELVLDGRACVYSEATQGIVFLNDTATLIWTLLDGRRTVDEVVSEVRVHFGSVDDLEGAVVATLASFRESGLLGDSTTTTEQQHDWEPVAQSADQLTGGWTLRALGLTGAIACDDRALDQTLRGLLRDLRSTGPHQDQGTVDFTVQVRGRDPWEISSPAHTCLAHDLSAAVDGTLTAVNLTAVATTPTLALHAAVVTRNGITLAIPGPSGQGKTTLTTALLQQGWSYVSDEALALDWRDSAVVTYPRPLALSPWAAALLGVRGTSSGQDVVIAASEVGTVHASEAPAVRHIVLLDRSPDQQPRLDVLHRADALASLVQRGFTHVRRPREAMVTLGALVSAAECWTLRLGDPLAAAAFLTRELG